MYKFFAGKEPVDVVWGIGSFQWGVFVENMGIIDLDLCEADVHLKFVATKANLEFKTNKNNPP